MGSTIKCELIYSYGQAVDAMTSAAPVDASAGGA